MPIFNKNVPLPHFCRLYVLLCVNFGPSGACVHEIYKIINTQPLFIITGLDNRVHLFALRGNCTYYVACTHYDLNVFNVMECPPKTFFNPSSGACEDASDNIRLDCSALPRKYDLSVLKLLNN